MGAGQRARCSRRAPPASLEDLAGSRRVHITVVELLHDSEHAPVLPFKSRKA